MADDFNATGADGDLDRILGDVYTCTRAWEAWEIGTMTEDDFEEAAHAPVWDDLIAWRDAAVAKALEVAGKPSAAPAAPTLSARITECKRIGGCLAEIGARTQPNSEPGLWRCGSCGRIPWDIPADVAAIPWGESR
jgi:hypothetical protein